MTDSSRLPHGNYHPIVLVDQPDDGLDCWGWVSTDVGPRAARNLLRPLMLDGELYRLTLKPERVWLLERADSWVWVEEGTPDAREFWRFAAVERARPVTAALGDRDA